MKLKKCFHGIVDEEINTTIMSVLNRKLKQQLHILAQGPEMGEKQLDKRQDNSDSGLNLYHFVYLFMYAYVFFVFTTIVCHL